MLDIAKLERRWLKYKIKTLFPYAALLSIFVISLVILFWFFFKPSVEATLAQATKNTESPKQHLPIAKDERMILEPSMQFMQTLDVLSPNAKESDPIPAVVNPQKTSQNVSKTMQTPPIASVPDVRPLKVPLPTLAKSSPPAINSKLTSIKRDDATFDIHEIEERFKSNSNANLGLYIARYHYDKGNYSEAYNYALKTNALNNSMDESWLIFAKSMVKLGKADQAKKTLQLYISNTNSTPAKNYLDSLDKESSK